MAAESSVPPTAVSVSVFSLSCGSVFSLSCFAVLVAAFAMQRREPPLVGLSSKRNNYTFEGRPLTALDASQRLFWVEDFLTEQEVNILRSVGAANPGAFEAEDRLDYATATLPRDNEVTREIEERIASLSGIAVNEVDSPIHLAVTRTWEPTRPNCFNLHHDTHKGFAERVATVLMFLSDGDADGLDGGDTIFPCLVPAGATAEERQRSTEPPPDLCARLTDGFERGERFLRINSASHDKPSFDAAASSAASDACAGPRSGPQSGGRGIRVQPRRGAAIFFWSADVEDGSPAAAGGDATPIAAHPEMWHGGCRVHAGAKWTAQQFKAWQAHDHR